ncbi:MAG: hypothetical protein H7A40_06300 [Chlamydiales bacterium]|nr:hypothetical protein [Chlamydiales bacterium]
MTNFSYDLFSNPDKCAFQLAIPPESKLTSHWPENVKKWHRYFYDEERIVGLRAELLLFAIAKELAKENITRKTQLHPKEAWHAITPESRVVDIAMILQTGSASSITGRESPVEQNSWSQPAR